MKTEKFKKTEIFSSDIVQVLQRLKPECRQALLALIEYKLNECKRKVQELEKFKDQASVYKDVKYYLIIKKSTLQELKFCLGGS